MNSFLTQKQIGQRISSLRKKKGFSQEDLAKGIKISRPSITQIELGNRGIDILELQELSFILEFSLDNFMSKDFLVNKEPEEKLKSTKIKERISVPTLDIGKLKNVLLYLLERCAGKSNINEAALYKLLYFSDFNYYEQYEEHLTGAKYQKLPFGPVPFNLDIIIKQMIDEKQLQKIKTVHHGIPQTRYLPLVQVDLTTLKASETSVIDGVIKLMGDWSVGAISDYAHKDLPWMASKEGAEINYELAFYRHSPYSMRNYENEMD